MMLSFEKGGKKTTSGDGWFYGICICQSLSNCALKISALCLN